MSNPNASGEPSAAERRIMRAIEEENETGLAVGVAEDFLRLMATTFVSNLRRRFEVRSMILSRF